MKLLATYQQNIPGNVENTILNCLKNVTLNHENQVACGELKLVGKEMFVLIIEGGGCRFSG